MGCHPAPAVEGEESAEIEFSEPDQPADQDLHLPLGLLQEAKQAIGNFPPERLAHPYLFLAGRRNNLMPLGLAKMSGMARERGCRNRFDYNPQEPAPFTAAHFQRITGIQGQMYPTVAAALPSIPAALLER